MEPKELSKAAPIYGPSSRIPGSKMAESTPKSDAQRPRRSSRENKGVGPAMYGSWISRSLPLPATTRQEVSLPSGLRMTRHSVVIPPTASIVQRGRDSFQLDLRNAGGQSKPGDQTRSGKDEDAHVKLEHTADSRTQDNLRTDEGAPKMPAGLEGDMDNLSIGSGASSRTFKSMLDRKEELDHEENELANMLRELNKKMDALIARKSQLTRDFQEWEEEVFAEYESEEDVTADAGDQLRLGNPDPSIIPSSGQQVHLLETPVRLTKLPPQQFEDFWPPPEVPFGIKQKAPPRRTGIIPPPPEFASTPAVKKPQTQPQEGQAALAPPNTEVSGVDALATALVQALQSQNRSTEKFVARQSQESKLPIFSGNPLEWPLFVHHYEQSTRDCGFTAAQNTSRLEKSLKGEARKSVQALMIVPSNADAVMERLKQRYGRPDYVVQALVEVAKKTPTLKEDKLSSVLDYSNAINNLVLTVKSLHVEAHLQNPQLIKELVEKLPDSLKLQWGMRARTLKTVTLVEFSSWVNEIADAASYVTIPKFSKEKKEASEKVYAMEETCAATTSPPDSSKPSKPTCRLCKKEGHYVGGCSQFQKMDVDDRWTFVKKEKLCFKCLRGGHGLIKCRSKSTCRVSGCTRRHHSLLHGNRPTSQPDAAPEEKVVEFSGSVQAKDPRVLLRICPVVLYGPEKSEVINVLMDDASAPTMLWDETAEKLELPGHSDPLRIKWTNEAVQNEKNSRRVQLFIGPVGEKTKYKMTDVRTVSHLKIAAQRVDMKKILESWSHLKGTKLKFLPDEPPKMIIGQRHIHLILARETREGKEGEPVLSKTKLGWVLHGPLSGSATESSTFSCFYQSDDQLLHDMVKEPFQLESIGISPYPSSRSKEDRIAEEKMVKVTRRVGDRWETGLLWKDDNIILPPSKQEALRRHFQLEKKFSKNREFQDQYKKKIANYLAKGYAHKCSPEELAVPTGKEWFLPHFATTHPNKPGKIRVVFDAASRSRGMSLNDALLTGPDLLVSLPGLLIRFRQRRIAIGGDINEMFHRIGIRGEDRPAQRFIWRDDETEEPAVYQLDVMMFGAVCSPYQAQYVKNKNATEFAHEFPAAFSAIVSKHYMDDYLDSMDTVDQAKQLIEEVTYIHKRGGFEIAKWISNSPELLETIPPDDRVEAAKNLAAWSEIPTERALELHWDPKEDAFTFRVNLERAGRGVATGDTIPSKRVMLRLIMLVWDPLGMLNHFMINARILLQDLWRTKVSWDDEIPLESHAKWKKWVAELPKIAKVKLPRCYSTRIGEANNVQLHIMCDASSQAYSCVAYLRVEYEDGNVEVSFVMSKARVAPIKPVSIPRLELQAALAACRLGRFIVEKLEVKIDAAVYWTDSMTVLKWIRSEARRFQQFVANRVGPIQELSNVDQWRWVPTKSNVADDATRDTKADLSSSSRWWNGPEFLRWRPEEWPKEEEAVTEVDEEALELKTEFCGAAMELPNWALPDVSRFSNYMRLVRATAYILRFVDMKTKKLVGNTLQVLRAEKLLIRRSQWESYPEEMEALTNEKPVLKSSHLFELSPILDQDGVMRMQSRLASVREDYIRLPIILHPKNPLTRLIIMYRHKATNHQGVDFVRNDLRQKFWIPNLRNTARTVLHQCGRCRLKKVKATPPYMGDLPDFRVQPQPRAFTITGMDYFGPFEVTVGRRHEKRYGVLFTCLTTRALHLEIAHSLTTDSCIMAIRRFVGRRGQPLELHSDNGTNLRGAEKELRMALKEIDQDEITAECQVKSIAWHFIPPSSAHMGGSWERLVRSVKNVLGSLLKTRYPKDEVLQTFFVEAEATVNSRPLTDVPVDHDSPEALTPMHFLIGTATLVQPPGNFDNENVDLAQQWRQTQILADMFWRRWIKEYRPTLQRRTKWFRRSPSLEVGDIVVVLDESLKRNSWPLGIVEQVFPGNDGEVRVAEVRTSSGTYRRPAVKLGRLDIRSAEVADEGISDEIGGKNVPAKVEK